MEKKHSNFRGVQYLILLGFVGLSMTSFGQQQQRLDSLLQIAEAETDPKVKVEQQLNYLNSLMASYSDSALMLVDELIAEHEQEEFTFGLARALSMKSWFLVFRLEYEEAHRLGHKALEMQQREGTDSAGIALTLNRIGIVNLQFERLNEAEDYITQALSYFSLLKDTVHMDMCLNNLGIVAVQIKDFESAINYYRQSLDIRLRKKMWHWVAFSYYNIASMYVQLSELDSAKLNMDKSTEIFRSKTLAKSIPPMVYLGLAELNYAQENWDAAIEYATISLDSANYLKRKGIAFEAKKFLPKVFYQKEDYQKAYEALLDYQNEKAIQDSLNNIAKVSKIEEQYRNVQKEKELVELRASELEANKKVQDFRLLVLSLSIAALAAVVILVYFNIKRRQKQQWMEADLNAKISEMKLIALRSQMNPHFIFNCINTAQNFVLHSQKQEAYDYLSKFAKLLRVVLENSDQTFISLEDEIHHLQLYIELEAIRFDKKFEYSFEVDEAIQDGIFEIPTMMLQPFVENAILHGLVNRKENGGMLKVVLKKEGSILHCTIQDNGVGRLQAAEIKKQKKKFYKSSALPNIKERLALIEKNIGLKLDLKIVDLNENEKAKGTLVNLSLPLR